MRKKLLIIITIISLFFLFFSGCATFNKADLEVINNAGLVSVYCDKRIDTSEFTSVFAGINELAQSKDFNLEVIAIQMKNDVFDEYAPYLPFSFLDEKDVTENPSYKSILSDLWFSTPAGYKAIGYGNQKVIDELFEAFPKANGLMFVWAYFKLHKESEILGFGAARVYAYHQLIIMDRSKKIILQKTNYAASKDIIEFALGGVFDAKEIQPLCIEALNKASEVTKAWIMKEMG